MDKILIQQNATEYTVRSPDSNVIELLEEELRQLGIHGISVSYGKTASLTVIKGQEDSVAGLDKEHWLWSAMDDRRPSGFHNWETAFLVEQLGFDEGAPYEVANLQRYVQSRMAPQAFYELFETEPKGDYGVIQWEKVSEALKD